MSVYHANEFIVGLPDGLKDKTVHIFSLTDEGPSELSVVVARERPKSGETLERFGERLLSALIGRLPLFHVNKKEVTSLSGQPAISTDYSWQSPEGKMFQRQIILHARAQNQMLLITATCRGDRMAARWEAMFGEFLTNFRLRA